VSGDLSPAEAGRVLAALDPATAQATNAATLNGRGDGRPTPKLLRLDVARMVAEVPPPVPWVVAGLVVRGSLTMLNGREGQGKSLLALALAAGVATGQSEAGMACEPGRVLVVDAENGRAEIHRRVHTLGLPADGMHCFEAVGFDLRHDLAELDGLLGELGPDLLVLDSFRTLWGGKENDSGEVAQVLDPLRNLVRRHQAGALLLHHSAKGSGDYRGSSAIGASIELGFSLGRREEDRGTDLRYIECGKCRPAPEPPKRWIRLAAEDGQVFIDTAESPDQEDAARAAAAPVRSELRPQVVAALRLDPQPLAAVARAAERDPKDRSVRRVLDELADAGEAEQVEAGWRKVAGWQPPIGTCHPATPATPHSRAESVGPPETPLPPLADRAQRTFTDPSALPNIYDPEAGA